MSGKAGITSLIALGLLASTSAYAEEFNLDEVVVSAGLVPVDEEKVGRAYTVVTGKQLEQSQTKYVADALRMVPGVAVNRTGSYGGLTAIRIRGSEDNHVLVLIDGVDVSNDASGTYDFGGLQVSDIDRIEILRGPQSSLFGSNATAGVIQIITKSGSRDGKTHASAQTEVGTDGTVLLNLGVRGGRDRFDYAFSGAFRRTDGFNVADNGSEKDGDKNLTLNGKFRGELTDTLSFDSSMRFVSRRSDTDDFSYALSGADDSSDAYSRTREFSGNIGFTNSLFDGHFVQKVRAKYYTVEARGFNSYGDSGATSDRISLNYQGTVFFDTPSFAAANHSLTGAVEWKRESYQNDFPDSWDPAQAEEQERNLLGFVVEYKGEFWDNLFFSSAIRHDQNDNFKDTTTYSSSLAYLFPQTGTRLHTSVGTGVTNPTLTEQFGFYPSMYQGNPALKPETNFGWDVGIEQTLFDDRFRADLTYFNERLEDEIDSIKDPLTGLSSPVNMSGTSKRHGIEVSGNAALTDSLNVKVAYTYLDAKDSTGAQELRRPRHSGSVNITKTFLDGRASAFVDAIFNMDMSDFQWFADYSSRRVSLADYAVVNVGADYQINDHAQIYGRVENLLDADYQEVYGYNTAGITGYVGLKADF